MYYYLNGIWSKYPAPTKRDTFSDKMSFYLQLHFLVLVFASSISFQLIPGGSSKFKYVPGDPRWSKLVPGFSIYAY